MGKFDTHGGYFAPANYFRVNTGGSHEENPNGGVQVGMDPQGIPNVLEEGEPVYDDYVFSDNITADKEFIEKHNLPKKYAGMLYSKIADSIVEEAEERPNDPISNDGLNVMLMRLADAQEEQKQIQEQQELEDMLSQMSPEELDQLDAMLAGQQEQAQPMPEAQVPVEAAASQQMIPGAEAMPVAPETAPVEQAMPAQVPVMANGGFIRKFETGGPKGNNQNLFTRLTLGAAMAENPAVMQASGWNYDRSGNVVQGDFNEEGPTRLREALSEISTIPMTEVGMGLIGPAIRGLRGVETATDIVEASRAAKAKAETLASAQKATNVGKTAYNAAKKGKATAEAAVQSAKTKEAAARKALKTAVENKDINSKAVQKAISRLADASLKVTDAEKAALKAGAKKVAKGVASGTLTGAVNTARVLPKVVGAPSAVATISAPYLTLLRNNNEVPVSQGYYVTAPEYQTDSTAVDVPTFTDAPQTVVTDPAARAALSSYESEIADLDFSAAQARGANGYARGGVMNTKRGPVRMFAGGSQIPPAYRSSVYDFYGAYPTTTTNNVGATVDLRPFNERVTENLREKGLLPASTLSTRNRTSLAQTQYDLQHGTYLSKEFEQNQPAPTNGTYPVLNTGMRYAGPLMAAGLGLYNAFQRPDRYTAQRINPVLPNGRMPLVNPVYNPIDENRLVNDTLASGAGTTRALLNSGIGYAAPVSLLAADATIGKNIGTSRAAAWDANNQQRNAILAQANQNAGTQSQFDYGVSRDRATMLNDSAYRNAYNDMMVQRLNNAAETEKYAAIQAQLDQAADALSKIGRENFYINQVNGNTAIPYITGHSGSSAYTNKGKNGGKIKRNKK